MDDGERRDDLNPQDESVLGAAVDSHGEQEGPPLPSLFSRILVLLFEPARLFQALRVRPVFWGAILLGSVLFAMSMVLIPAELHQEAAAREQEEMMRRMEAMGVDVSEIPEREMEGPPLPMRALFIIPMFIGMLVGSAITAGILTVVFRFAMGYEGSYRQYLSVVAHASLVVALGALLLTPMRVIAQRADYALNLGSFVPFLDTGFLARFFESIDLFNLWCVVLIGLGIAVVDGTRPPRTAIGVMVGLMLILAVATAAFGGLFQRG